jgi:polar amino acid transport system substrate-binding protein
MLRLVRSAKYQRCDYKIASLFPGIGSAMMLKVFNYLMLMAMLSVTECDAQTIQAVTEISPATYLKVGKVAGPYTEIVELTLKNAGLTDYYVNLYPWARSYDMALNTPNILIFGISRTPARERLFKWVGELRKLEFQLYKLKQRKDIVIGTLAKAKTYVIGVIREDIRQQYFQQQGFTKLVISAHMLENFNQLVNRQVDLIALNTFDDANTLCQATGFDCSNLEKVLFLKDLSSSVYVAYSKSTPDAIVERTRTAFEKVKSDGDLKRILGKRE